MDRISKVNNSEISAWGWFKSNVYIFSSYKRVEETVQRTFFLTNYLRVNCKCSAQSSPSTWEYIWPKWQHSPIYLQYIQQHQDININQWLPFNPRDPLKFGNFSISVLIAKGSNPRSHVTFAYHVYLVFFCLIVY